METVKKFNAKRSEDGVLLGETSRSDLLDGEGVSHISVPKWDGTQPESRLRDFKFPQPKLAQSHTLNNVCAAPFSFFTFSLWLFVMIVNTPTCRCHNRSIGSTCRM